MRHFYFASVSSHNLTEASGEDGIRTHVPVKANGFQDRLVMTASIPLHNVYLLSSTPSISRRNRHNIKTITACQLFFLNFANFYFNPQSALSLLFTICLKRNLKAGLSLESRVSRCKMHFVKFKNCYAIFSL